MKRHLDHPVEQALSSTLTIYYDGSCPLCAAEMQYLQHKDLKGELVFEDITRTHFDPCAHRVQCDQAMKSIVGRLSTGEELQGIAVFQCAYEKVGLKKLAWLLSRPSLQAPLNGLYLRFAANRQSFSKILGPFALWLTRKITKRQSINGP